VEKLKPSYSLSALKAAFSDPAKLNMTVTASRDAMALNIDNSGIVAAIAAVQRADFEKSMTAQHNHKLWQDVYKPTFNGTELYVKFTRDSQGQFLLISFKQR
jgi:motility quorum-sensing regulator / GCU-specific mRNA interferase toxin